MSLRSFDRPGQVPKDRVFENFRNPDWRKNRKSDWRDKRPGMSPAHLAAIRQLQCSVCFWSADTEAHHLKSNAARLERGVGFKATDRWAVPLCVQHHREIEGIGSRREVAWFADVGMDPHALANGLWNRSGDLEAMRRVLEVHKQSAIRNRRR